MIHSPTNEGIHILFWRNSGYCFPVHLQGLCGNIRGPERQWYPMLFAGGSWRNHARNLVHLIDPDMAYSKLTTITQGRPKWLRSVGLADC